MPTSSLRRCGDVSVAAEPGPERVRPHLADSLGGTVEALNARVKIPLSTARKLQECIDDYVERIERVATVVPFSGRSCYRKVYCAVRDAERPVDYKYVMAVVGTEPAGAVSGRLSYLERQGYIRQQGNVRTEYYKDGIGAKAFVGTPLQEVPRIRRKLDRLVAEMIEKVETLTFRSITVPVCIAERIKQFHPTAKWKTDRNRELISLRLRGFPLKTIGAQFGISGECVRQIVNRAANPKPRLARPEPLESDLIVLPYTHRARGILAEVAVAILEKYNS